jgi:hypothetical protein
VGGSGVLVARFVHGKVPRGVVVDPPRPAAAVQAVSAGGIGEAVRAEGVGAALPKCHRGLLGAGGLALAVSVRGLSEEGHRRVGGEAREEEEGSKHVFEGSGYGGEGVDVLDGWELSEKVPRRSATTSARRPLRRKKIIRG